MTCGNGTYNITINQYSTFNLALTWNDNTGAPINLTGYSAEMQIRETVDSATAYLTLSSPSSGIVLGGTAGTVTITIAASVTGAFTWQTGVYDLLLTSGSGVATRLLQGQVYVSPAVTT